jgi:hypothetical protein
MKIEDRLTVVMMRPGRRRRPARLINSPATDLQSVGRTTQAPLSRSVRGAGTGKLVVLGWFGLSTVLQTCPSGKAVPRELKPLVATRHRQSGCFVGRRRACSTNSDLEVADVNRHNNRGQTPLAGAVFKNETTIMELLLGADADPLAGSPSALETARYFGKEQLARQLLQHMQRQRSVNV